MPTGQLCSQCHGSGHNRLSPKCSVNITNKQSEALAVITAARKYNLHSRNNNNNVQLFNPSPAKEGELNSIADSNLLNDFICHPTATTRPKSQSKNHSPLLAQSSYIEATPADDEFRRNVQDLSDYRGIGAVAWGKHISGNGGRQDLGKPAPTQRAIAYSHIAQDIFGSVDHY